MMDDFLVFSVPKTSRDGLRWMTEKLLKEKIVMF